MEKLSPQEADALIKKSIKKDDTLVFDCDGTLIDGDISLTVAAELISKGLANTELIPEPWAHPEKHLDLSEDDFLKICHHVEAFAGPNGVYEWEIHLQSGLYADELIEVSDQALQKALTQKKVQFTSFLSSIAKEYSSQTWIVSGSSQPTVASVGKILNIPSERVLGTELEKINNVYTRRISSRGLVWQDGKRKYLLDQDVKNIAFVAGDTVGDWEMMQLSQQFKWSVIWDEFRHRGTEYRAFLEERLSYAHKIPKEPGIYFHNNWFFEVKNSP